jgi:hypothetical protein
MKTSRVSVVGSCIVCAIASTQLAKAASPEPACAPSATAEHDVVLAVEQMYKALRADDSPGFKQIATADFYAYDNGARFTGPSLLELVRKAHATGTRYEWSVTQPEAHIACNVAWVTYVNQGSIANAEGQRQMSWLESVVLEYREQKWRIHFLHSTRTTSPVAAAATDPLPSGHTTAAP